MSEKSTLSLGGKLSAETQSKLKALATKPKEATTEPPKVNDANVKNDSKSAKTENPSPRSEQQDKKHKAIELRKKQIEHAKALYKYHFSYFSKLYPKCFSQTPKPLVIGIHEAMITEEAKKPEEERLSKTAIKKFLLKYTQSLAYKESLQSGSARINLQGEEVDKVTTEHAEFAKKSLEEWKSKRAKQKNNNKHKQQKPHHNEQSK
jgi:hypothetical protein